MAVVKESRSMSICIVESDLEKADRLQRLLTTDKLGKIISINSVQKFMDRLRESHANNFDDIGLVVLGENNQKADIFEVCRLLVSRIEYSDIAIILLVDPDSNTLSEAIKKGYEAGALDVIPANAQVNELLPRVSLALNLQQEKGLRKMREEVWETERAERKIMEARLKYLVAHDDLTGLSNRRRLEQALELAIIRSRNFHRNNALIYIDLDQFKIVNDAEGHDIGDRMLIDVANVLRNFVKQEYLVSRLGSDEFTILLEHVSETTALEYAEELRKTLADHVFTLNAISYHIFASIGVVINVPEETITVSKLLAKAEQACYIAKTQGRNIVYKFSDDDEGLQELRNYTRWVPIIRNALANNRFFLVFQPIMDLKTKKILHYEALTRMHGENDEVYTPADFIPVAERMGMIHQIDLWVVEHVLDFMSNLPEEHNDVGININLSGHAFQDASLLALIKQKLEMTWVSASRITFEITETAAITNFSETRKMVARLRALGCRFALDDFGSGFCSFSYIKNYPVDTLKLDGSFIVNIINDETDMLLVKSMTEIAHSLGKKVVAEYVENKEILSRMVECGVDYVQGFYVGVPEKFLLHEDAFINTSDQSSSYEQGFSEFDAFVDQLMKEDEVRDI
ncbi:MAG: EAL domain-containing protein [Gammaproteobacteria bacterium]|nr:EAL domain-containing protein [Gammaproteobacteria bacterium]